MTAPVPKLEVEELLNETVAHLRRRTDYSPFEYQKLLRRIDALFQKGTRRPELAYITLSIVEAQMGKRDEAKASLYRALDLAPKDAILLSNGIAALADLGDLRESMTLLNRLVEKHPDDVELLPNYISQACFFMQYRFAGQLLERLEKLSVNIDPKPFADRRVSLLGAIENIDASGFSDEDLLQRVETAIDAVRHQGHVVRRTTIQTLHSGEIVYNLMIDADYEECARQTFAVSDALAEQYQDAGERILSVVVRPLSDYFEIGEARV